MKPIYISLLLFFICFSPNMMALDVAQLEQYKQRLSNPNPSERLAAMDELGNLVGRSPDSVNKEVIAIVTNGIGDSDSKVRYNAVSLAAALGMQTRPAQFPVQPGTFDLRSYPPLQVALRQAMVDSDAEIRHNAIAAYVFTFKFSAELQQKLMTQFDSDESNRDAIVSALIIDGNFNAPLTSLLLRLFDDPKYDHVIAQNIATSLVLPPAALLPKLADKLAHAQDSARKQMFARAIAKYGAQARPYLEQIEQMRDKETDASTNFNLKAAVEAVRGPAPPTSPAPVTPVAQNPAPVVERKPPVWPWVVGIAALTVIALLVWKHRTR